MHAIAKELFLRRNELAKEPIETLYFGGGTPSLLNEAELNLLMETLHKNFDLSALKEFTLEANPDDLHPESLRMFKSVGIDRLSIGIQSFEEEHLRMMNRAHSAEEAKTCVQQALNSGIQKISIDLIYGIPGMSLTTWEKNLNLALDMGIDHLSSYCLTIEPQTVFGRQQARRQFEPAREEAAEEHFKSLITLSAKAGFEHYEISNFARPNAYSLHNTAYWQGKSYLGAGPGAHSHYPGKRMWNVSNNQHYLKAIEANKLPLEEEILSINDQYNEYIMTALRTKWGVSLVHLEQKFGADLLAYFLRNIKPFLGTQKVLQEGQTIHLSEAGKFLADGIAAAAFRLS